MKIFKIFLAAGRKPVGGGAEKMLAASETLRIQKFAECGGASAELWIIPEASQTKDPVTRPEEYASRMLGFFHEACINAS
jgi:hypothetical protein